MLELTRLVGPFVLIERHPTPDRTFSGIYLPSSAVDAPQIGWVRAVGAYWGGRPLEVVVGDLVMFSKWHDRYLHLGGVDYLWFAWCDPDPKSHIYVVIRDHDLLDPRRGSTAH